MSQKPGDLLDSYEEHIDEFISKERKFERSLIRFFRDGRINVIKELLKRGLNPNIRNDDGNTLLIIASKQGYLNIVKELLRYGADINSTDDKGNTALVWACVEDYRDIIHELLSHGADPNIRDDKGTTALYWIDDDDGDIAQELLRHGAISNIVDNKGNTPLIDAARHNNFWIVVALLNPSAGPKVDLNIANNKGQTALLVASRHGITCIVKKLLMFGANPDIVDISGRSPLDHARKHRHVKIVRLLENYFITLQMLSLQSVEKHRIDIKVIPKVLRKF